MTAAEFIVLLKQHAVGLREVGVLSLNVEGAAATFLPAMPPAPELKPGDQVDTGDPLAGIRGYDFEPDPSEAPG